MCANILFQDKESFLNSYLHPLHIIERRDVVNWSNCVENTIIITLFFYTQTIELVINSQRVFS